MSDIVQKLACVFVSFAILGNAYFTRRIVGSWSAPGALFSLFWFAMTFLPLVLLPAVPANPWALLYILAACVVMSLSAGLKRWGNAWRQRAYYAPVTGPVYNTHFLFVAFLGCAAGAMLCIILSIFTQGFSITDLTTNLIGSASEYINRRYNQDLIQNLFQSCGNVFSYATSALGGLVLLGLRARSRRFLTITLVILPGLLVMVVQGAKGMLFLNLAMFFGGTLIYRLHRGDRRIFDKGFFVKGAPYFAAIFAAVTFAFLARGISASSIQEAFEPLVKLYGSYAAGHLYAFSDWFSFYTVGESSQPYAREPATYGFYTFMTIFQLFGDKREVYPGIYAEYFTYSYYLQTNIYTIFRGLIQDFGIPGSLLIIGVFGFITNELYYSLIAKPISGFRAASYIFMMGIFYMSYLISIFIWTSPLAAAALVWVVLFFNASTFAGNAKKVGPLPTLERPALR